MVKEDMQMSLRFVKLTQKIPNAELIVQIQRCPMIDPYVCLLAKMGFRFSYLDVTDCEAVLESDYFDVFNKMYELQEKGFRW